MSLDLTGRRVMVTGGGQGVGRGVALGFATAGAEVVVNDLEPERAQTVVEEIAALGGAGQASVFDVTEFSAVEAAVEVVGRIDVLKAGAAGLTRALALENGRHGITANNISLGTMRTPATEPIWADSENEMAKSMLRSYVVRRPGNPDDVASLAVYLASDHASWITGHYSFAL